MVVTAGYELPHHQLFGTSRYTALFLYLPSLVISHIIIFVAFCIGRFVTCLYLSIERRKNPALTLIQYRAMTDDDMPTIVSQNVQRDENIPPILHFSALFPIR